MLRCNSPSSSELKEISEEKSVESEDSEEEETASETEDTLAEASEMAGTEGGWWELIGNKGVEESSTSELIGKGRTTSVLSSHRTEKLEEKSSEGETLESGSWV